LQHPTVVNFSRRTAIRASLLDAYDENAIDAREMEPFHADYSTLSATTVLHQVESATTKLNDVMTWTMDQENVHFTFKSLGEVLRNSRVSPTR
jgi:beta-glucanase (GH16 family)